MVTVWEGWLLRNRTWFVFFLHLRASLLVQFHSVMPLAELIPLACAVLISSGYVFMEMFLTLSEFCSTQFRGPESHTAWQEALQAVCQERGNFYNPSEGRNPPPDHKVARKRAKSVNLSKNHIQFIWLIVSADYGSFISCLPPISRPLQKIGQFAQ